MCRSVVDPGATGPNANLCEKSKNVLAILKIFGPLDRFYVCHTVENTLVTCTWWVGAPTKPLTIMVGRNSYKPPNKRSVNIRTLLGNNNRAILPMQVRGQLLVLLLTELE